jgi:hypothetical protein
MFVWNPDWNDGTAVNVASLSSITVTGSGSTWGVQGQDHGGGVTIAPNGTYATKTEAVAAVIQLMQTVGYVDVP